MKEFLKSIQTKLATVTDLKYVDEDWGQLDDYSPNPPVKWPCCLIDLDNAVYTNLGIDRSATPQNRQQATASVVFKYANMKLTRTSSKAPESQKDNAWLLHEIIEKSHEVLHGFRPTPESGVLLRTTWRKVKRDDGIQVFLVTYTFGLNNV